jgi:hypothetical protein
MGIMDNQADQATSWRSRRHRLRLECRECQAICERVVYPWQCLKSNCEGIYMYEDGETMYFGCLYKVFAAEFDIAFFSDRAQPAAKTGRDRSSSQAEGTQLAHRGRSSGRTLKGSDPFGPVKVTRSPRQQCPIRVEQAYEPRSTGHGCCNPTFFHHPFGAGGDAMRLTTIPLDGGNDGPET